MSSLTLAPAMAPQPAMSGQDSSFSPTTDSSGMGSAASGMQGRRGNAAMLEQLGLAGGGTSDGNGLPSWVNEFMAPCVEHDAGLASAGPAAPSDPTILESGLQTMVDASGIDAEVVLGTPLRGDAQHDEGVITIAPAAARERGAELLGHELAHVVQDQQNGAPQTGAPQTLAPGTKDAAEDEADGSLGRQITDRLEAGKPATDLRAQAAPTAEIQFSDPSAGSTATAAAPSTAAAPATTAAPTLDRTGLLHETQAYIGGLKDLFQIVAGDVGRDMQDQAAALLAIKTFEDVLREQLISMLSSFMGGMVDQVIGELVKWAGMPVEDMLAGVSIPDNDDSLEAMSAFNTVGESQGSMAMEGADESSASTTPAPDNDDASTQQQTGGGGISSGQETAATPAVAEGADVIGAIEKVKVTDQAIATVKGFLKSQIAACLIASLGKKSGKSIVAGETLEMIMTNVAADYISAMTQLDASCAGMSDLTELAVLREGLRQMATVQRDATMQNQRASIGLAVVQSCAQLSSQQDSINDCTDVGKNYTLVMTFADLESVSPQKMDIPGLDAETWAALSAMPGVASQLPISVVLEGGLLDLWQDHHIATIPAGSTADSAKLAPMNIDHFKNGHLYYELIKRISPDYAAQYIGLYLAYRDSAGGKQPELRLNASSNETTVVEAQADQLNAYNVHIEAAVLLWVREAVGVVDLNTPLAELAPYIGSKLDRVAAPTP